MDAMKDVAADYKKDKENVVAVTKLGNLGERKLKRRKDSKNCEAQLHTKKTRQSTKIRNKIESNVQETFI